MKELISIGAILVSFIAFIPYAKKIVLKQVTPHFLTWIIWSITTLVVFLAQRHDGGGAGSWPTGVSALLTLCIAFLSVIYRGDLSITKADKTFFSAAIIAMVCWWFTSDPLWAVVILTIIDLLGFAPTYRKALTKPYSESIVFFGLFVVQYGLVLLALERYSVTTTLFPSALGLACLIFIITIYIRRMQCSALDNFNQ